LGKELSETVGFAYRRRYSLPITDPRWLASTDEDVLVDYWAHRFCDDPKLRDEVVNEDFDDDLAEMERAAMAAERLPPEDWEQVVSDKYGDSPT